MEKSHSEQNAIGWFESIKEMVSALRWFDENDPDDENLVYPTIDGNTIETQEQARQCIEESPLSVQVRYGWISPGSTDEMLKSGPEEYEILLSTGGPALRIIGRLGEYNEPETAQLQHQDWGTPWTDYISDNLEEQDEILLAYARCFYFGE